MTVHEAAIKLGVNPSEIEGLIRSGDIQAKREGRGWVIVDTTFIEHVEAEGAPTEAVELATSLSRSVSEPGSEMARQLERLRVLVHAMAHRINSDSALLRAQRAQVRELHQRLGGEDTPPAHEGQ